MELMQHRGSVFSQQNLDIADAAPRSQPEVDPSRWGCWVIQWVVVMSTGIRNPDRFAATAVSPTGAAVTPQVPRNPTVAGGQLGSWLCHHAKRLLVAAGGENENLLRNRVGHS